MQNGIHFISGLPRAGSTLLSALLLQNPGLHAGITAPVGHIFGAMLREVSQGSEGAVMIDDSQRQALLRGIFENYYHAIHPSRTVFDTNRIWCTRLHLLAELFPQARIICCAGHIPWFDAGLGTPGLYEVKTVVAPSDRETILPPDLWQRYEGLSIWRDPAFNRRGIRIV